MARWTQVAVKPESVDLQSEPPWMRLLSHYCGGGSGSSANLASPAPVAAAPSATLTECGSLIATEPSGVDQTIARHAESDPTLSTNVLDAESRSNDSASAAPKRRRLSETPMLRWTYAMTETLVQLRCVANAWSLRPDAMDTSVGSDRLCLCVYGVASRRSARCLKAQRASS